MRKRFYFKINIVKQQYVTRLNNANSFEVSFDNIHAFRCNAEVNVHTESGMIYTVPHGGRSIATPGRTISKLKITLNPAQERELNQLRDWFRSCYDPNSGLCLYRNEIQKNASIRMLNSEGNVIRDYSLSGVIPESMEISSDYMNTEINFDVDSIQRIERGVPINYRNH